LVEGEKGILYDGMLISLSYGSGFSCFVVILVPVISQIFFDFADEEGREVLTRFISTGDS
jgi:hypothetical protein